MSEFGTLDLDLMTGEGERLQDAGQGNFLDQFVPMPIVKAGQVGSVVIRVLPPVKGGSLFVATRVHTLNGRKHHCPKPLVNGKWAREVPCPICDYYSALWRKVDKLEDAGRKEEAAKLKEEARSIKPVERYYYNAIVRSLIVDGKELKNVGPRILSIGKIVHKMIVRAILGDDTEPGLGDVTNIRTGFDFIIKKELRGTGDEAFPNYDQSKFARDPSAAGSGEELKKWAESLHDLSKLRSIKPVDFLEKELAIHRGLIPDEQEGFDIDKFDAKYAEEQQGEIDEIMKSPDVQVNVPASVTSKPKASVKKEETPLEDVSIDASEFFDELNAMDVN